MASGPKFGVGVGVFTDAKRTVGADHRFVESAQEVRLLLEASLDGDGSISGSLRGAQGESRPFSGWLGLAAAITELADRERGESLAASRDPGKLLQGELEPRQDVTGQGSQHSSKGEAR
ncbi:MAG TPA: hypothetical protein VE401_03190 [Solirubrobacterales bacterium]|nr:hypothetical protein [Solirubrobacterales bacterium]